MGALPVQDRFRERIRHYGGCRDYPYDREMYKLLAGAPVLHNPYHR
ncbi:MAG: hypothetical protein ACLFRY_00745 [Spirochaetia bacterium]